MGLTKPFPYEASFEDLTPSQVLLCLCVVPIAFCDDLIQVIEYDLGCFGDGE